MPNKGRGIKELVLSRRFEQVSGAICTVLGVLLFLAPFVLPSVPTSSVIVMWFSGAFLVILGALLSSTRTPIGEGGRFQA